MFMERVGTLSSYCLKQLLIVDSNAISSDQLVYVNTTKQYTI